MSRPATPPPAPWYSVRRLRAARRDVLLGVPAVALLLAGLTAWVFVPYARGARHWQRAAAALADRDLDAAADHLRAYTKIHPSSAAARFLLARTLRRAGRFDEADTALDAARRLDWVPEQIELEAALRAVQQNGARGPLRDTLDRLARDRHPDEEVVLEALFLGDRATLDLPQAGRWLDRWVADFPDAWPPRRWRAELTESTARFDQAQADYQKLLELKPEYPPALLGLARVALAHGGRYAKAEDYAARALAARPDDPEALVLLGRCRRDQGDPGGAADRARQAQALAPEHGPALLLLGSAEADAGRPEAALPWLRRAEAAGADPQAVQQQLAQVLTQLGRPAEAAEHAARVARLARADREMTQALQALLADPDNPDKLHALGAQYVALGEAAKAERVFQLVLRRAPDHAPSHRALADVYAARGPGYAALAEEHRRRAGRSR